MKEVTLDTFGQKHLKAVESWRGWCCFERRSDFTHKPCSARGRTPLWWCASHKNYIRSFNRYVCGCQRAISCGVLGCICGARFSFTMVEFWQAIGFILLIFIASAGIGLLIGTFIKNVHGTIMSGVGLTVVSAAISGVMTPYAYLPSVLQNFARIYPISSANSSIAYLLVGINYAGYNPLSTSQVILTIIISSSLFSAGLIAYSKFCWRREWR